MGRVVPRYRLELVRESSKVYNVGDIKAPKDVKDYVEEIFNLSAQAEELFVILVLDTKNKVLGAFEVSRGTVNMSLVHPREVFKRALLMNGTSIIAAHNHPSGDSRASKEDIRITERLREAGKLLGIELLDHVIVTEYGFYSIPV